MSLSVFECRITELTMEITAFVRDELPENLQAWRNIFLFAELEADSATAF